MYKLDEIQESYFKNYEIRGAIEEKINKKLLLIEKIISVVPVTITVIFMIIHMVNSIDILILLGIILTIGKIILFISYLKYCKLLESYTKSSKRIVNQKQDKGFKKDVKLYIQRIKFLIKEFLVKETNKTCFYIGLMSEVIYWITIIFIVYFNIEMNNEFLFFLFFIIIVIMFIISRLIFLYIEVRYIIKEGLKGLERKIVFWDLFKYKQLKREIVKINQDKFFEDYPALKNIEVINCLIEVSEKKILYSDNEINKKDNSLMYQTWIITLVTWIINKTNNLDKALIWLFSLPFLLKIVQKIYNVHFKSRFSHSFILIDQNKKFLQLLEEKKFELLIENKK